LYNAILKRRVNKMIKTNLPQPPVLDGDWREKEKKNKIEKLEALEEAEIRYRECKQEYEKYKSQKDNNCTE
jgi:hypothetical protein